jgi:hypothetical protein
MFLCVLNKRSSSCRPEVLNKGRSKVAKKCKETRSKDHRKLDIPILSRPITTRMKKLKIIYICCHFFEDFIFITWIKDLKDNIAPHISLIYCVTSI